MIEISYRNSSKRGNSHLLRQSRAKLTNLFSYKCRTTKVNPSGLKTERILTCDDEDFDIVSSLMVT